MKNLFVAVTLAGVALPQASVAQSVSEPGLRPPAEPAPAAEQRTARMMPANTLVAVTPREEISSKHVERGQKVSFATVNDVVENGSVVIPRGSGVTGTITWKTGRAIGGKSGKFEVTFNSVNVLGREYRLSGKYRQEGRGNTVGALLGSIVISGRSAVMLPGDIVNTFTAEPVPYF